MHEHIKDICRRLAKLGYYAIATDSLLANGDATDIFDITHPHLHHRLQGAGRRCFRIDHATVAFATGGRGRHREARRDRLLLGRPEVPGFFAEHNPKPKAAAAGDGPLDQCSQ